MDMLPPKRLLVELMLLATQFKFQFAYVENLS